MMKACIVCGRIVPAGMGSRCLAHGGGITDNQRRHAKAVKHGTNTAHWKKLRALALQRDGYRCTFNYPGCTEIAETVHIDQRLHGNHRIAQLEHCRSACRRCHGREDAPRASRR